MVTVSFSTETQAKRTYMNTKMEKKSVPNKSIIFFPLSLFFYAPIRIIVFLMLGMSGASLVPLTKRQMLLLEAAWLTMNNSVSISANLAMLSHDCLLNVWFQSLVQIGNSGEKKDSWSIEVIPITWSVLVERNREKMALIIVKVIRKVYEYRCRNLRFFWNVDLVWFVLFLSILDTHLTKYIQLIVNRICLRYPLKSKLKCSNKKPGY